MQNYTDIQSTQTLTDSRELILGNDLTSISCSSGSSFPTAYAIVGMLCYRTDTKVLHQLKQLPANVSSNWHVIADLNQDYTYKAYVDANFALKGGDYSGLRARATTKSDVGLSTIPNSISSSLSSNTNGTLATSRAAYTLNNLITDHEGRIDTIEAALPNKAHKNGSTSNYFRASTIYANSTIHSKGDIIAESSVAIPSDRRLKKDIFPIDDALERLESLTGVTYTLKSNERECVGLIAQEVAETIPEVVRIHGEYLALDYASLAGVFVNAINEINSRLKLVEGKHAAL